MNLLFTVYLLSIPIQIFGINKDIIRNPFDLRARLHGSHTATVQFEIEQNSNQRLCQMYNFTIRYNHQVVYSMSEQNLTCERNSLELKDLTVGDYEICAIICSEYLKQDYLYDRVLNKTNTLKPITACINIHVKRAYLLILTIYLLIFMILALAHINYSLRKREFHARVRRTYIEFENSLQQWRTYQKQSMPSHGRQSSHTLHDFLTSSTSPIEHSTALLSHLVTDELELSYSNISHLEIPNETEKTVDIPENI
ncbi:unnamed protein product [Rotaria sordida]|uniref:Uncharacterized protein n=1 Tax=Rotaria sordida TaxID=392033 RepID=A0A819DLH6_9BILA|nr:unnamed protein product [Rotaria sordida]CAF1302321.1 unnamed protein product [Rotaria sordida]CAF1327812.1 unnamed protein product [Rotaria sordida]CAF3625747.1 unnamed protein product [Rotaria sordida]CAF3726737.1 unnamed protein product [Rotaria sordida]